MKGAEIIAEYLIRERVPYVVGLCGHGDLGLLDALYDRSDQIRTLSVHHESAAGFIADAYYRIRHEPLATLTSVGPGAANLPVALGSAFMDSSAFLAITGNVPTTQFNRAPFQETGRYYQADTPGLLRPYVKRSFQATRADQLPLMLRQAFAAMLGGRPGPVHLDVPLDVFVETSEAEVPDPGQWRRGISRRSAAAPADVAAMLGMLAAAERPLIVAGYGVQGAEAAGELATFATAAQIPVATSPLGKIAGPLEEGLYLGATGRNGTYQANRAARTADVILALGTRFDDRSTSSWLPGYTYTIPPTRLIQVDIDPAELGRNYPVALGVAASPKEVLTQLREGMRAVPDTGRWLADIAQWAQEWERHTAPNRSSGASPLRPERVLAELRRVLPEDGILISDVGVHHNWIVQEWRPGGPGTLLQSWGFASMCFGMAGVLGARLAAPDTPAVAVVGDGGFLMLPSVVASAVEYGIPAVWLVWNNGGYISIRDQQRGYFGAGRELATSFRYAATGGPYSADYAAMARSMGAQGLRAETPGDLGSALQAALGSGLPTVIDVPVAADADQPSAATWQLPPLHHPEPTFGWPDPDSRLQHQH
ncbi:MAG TPA: thiamine pyrophosphate-binding protein [Streptosporangiaceae bacterium]|nr:thiamine pyrophosphate-binding protein [Streptosporangiaceae bacterium]